MIWWKLNSCPRCSGDMFIEKELYYGWYEQCIMCGYTFELKSKVELEHQMTAVRTRKKENKTAFPNSGM